ncbi:hypothetical protein D3C81_1958730 [compost metagenome]
MHQDHEDQRHVNEDIDRKFERVQNVEDQEGPDAKHQQTAYIKQHHYFLVLYGYKGDKRPDRPPSRGVNPSAQAPAAGRFPLRFRRR